MGVKTYYSNERTIRYYHGPAIHCPDCGRMTKIVAQEVIKDGWVYSWTYDQNTDHLKIEESILGYVCSSIPVNSVSSYLIKPKFYYFWKTCRGESKNAPQYNTDPELEHPEGSLIHVVHVKVNFDRPWKEAIVSACPTTPEDYSPILKMENQYPRCRTGETEEDIVLIYLGEQRWWKEAMAWAHSAGLIETIPCEVFAIAEQHPNLNVQFCQGMPSICATTECEFSSEYSRRGLCQIQWVGGDPWASIRRLENFGYFNDWFSFRKPSK
jgi:hypothetical protein